MYGFLGSVVGMGMNYSKFKDTDTGWAEIYLFLITREGDVSLHLATIKHLPLHHLK